MKVEQSTVTKINISEVDSLDPITVIIEDIEKNKGKIIIECFGSSWSSYWGAMSGTVAEFFCSCDAHYLASSLSSIRTYVDDFEGLAKNAKETVIGYRRNAEISKELARELYNYISNIEACDSVQDLQDDLMSKIIGDEWWRDVPTKDNPDYVYLCNIISTVQKALRSIETPSITVNMLPADVLIQRLKNDAYACCDFEMLTELDSRMEDLGLKVT